MPEALAIIGVVFVCGGILVSAWLQGRSRAPNEVRAVLKQRLQWLDDRLKTAQTERWSADMMASLNEQRATALAELARIEKPGN